MLVASGMLLGGCVSTAPAEHDLNTRFEAEAPEAPDQPLGWYTYFSENDDYAITLDDQQKREGRYALCIRSLRDTSEVWAGLAIQHLPIWFKMRDLRLRGYIKREGVTQGIAQLWTRLDRNDGFPLYEGLPDWEVSPNEDWTWYEVPIRIDARSRELTFGAILRGNGTAWFDSLALEVDGHTYAHAAARAQEAVEGLWLPQLREAIQPVSYSELPTTIAEPQVPVTVLFVSDDGSGSQLEMIQRIWQQGGYDYLLLDGDLWATRQVVHALRAGKSLDTVTLKALLPAWQPTYELAMLLQMAAQESPNGLMGLGVGEVDSILRSVDNWAIQRASAYTPLTHMLDSLHQHLRDQLGRRETPSQSLRLLDSLHAALGRVPSFQTDLPGALPHLKRLHGYYASNASTRYWDSCRLAQLNDLHQQHPDNKYLVITKAPYGSLRSRSWTQQLREQWGKKVRCVGLTVGKGETLNARDNIQPVPPPGPHCYAHYWQQMDEEMWWLDLRKHADLWTPRYMFWRSHFSSQRSLPFITLALREHFDAILYIDRSWPAQTLTSLDLKR